MPENIEDPAFYGYEDSDIRCKHDMPMYKYVCFEAENTGRRFLGCGCKVGHFVFCQSKLLLVVSSKCCSCLCKFSYISLAKFVVLPSLIINHCLVI